jgi:Flp pilus assembly protein TadD
MPNGVDSTVIVRHLNEILTSDGFLRSKRLAAFLTWIVEKSLAGDGDSITERNIAICVYHRREPFDPKIDGIVRTEAIRLRNKLREYYQGAPEVTARIDVPKGAYKPVFEGFDLAPKTASVPRLAWFVSAAAVTLLAILPVALRKPAHARLTSDQLLAESERLRLVGDNLPALSAADKAVQMAPRSGEAHMARAKALFNLGHMTDAREEIGIARQFSGEDPAAIAYASFLNRDSSRASDTLHQIETRAPASLDPRIQLAQLQLATGDSPGALATIAAARRLPGAAENPELDRLEATGLGNEGKTEPAIRLVLHAEDTALALHAQSAIARLKVLEGGLRQNHGENRAPEILREAREMCEALGDDMCVARTYRVDGNRLVVEGHLREGLAVYRTALPTASRWMNAAELERLTDGIEAVVRGLTDRSAVAPGLDRRAVLFRNAAEIARR